MKTDPTLQVYLERIRYDGPISVTYDTLKQLQEQHATHIPMDASAIYLQQPEKMDLKSIQQKLIFDGRSGMCLQQNRLFQWVLETLGFNVLMHHARGVVFREPGKVPMRVHVCLTVIIEDETYLVDVGSTQTPLRPVPFSQEDSQDTEDVRVVKTNEYWGGYLFQKRPTGTREWQDIYVFTLEPFYDVDLESMYTVVFATGANRGRLKSTLIVTKPTKQGRLSIYDREFIKKAKTFTETTAIQSIEQYVQIMKEEFNTNVDLETEKLLSKLYTRSKL